MVKRLEDHQKMEQIKILLEELEELEEEEDNNNTTY
tara:strand:- start:58 stop:165 length:108 start_codon:yes stop_codon:yes gene_type:complete